MFSFALSCNSTKMTQKRQKEMNSDRKKNPYGMGDNNSYILCIEQENRDLFSGALGVILGNNEMKQKCLYGMKSFQLFPFLHSVRLLLDRLKLPRQEIGAFISEEIYPLNILCLLDFSEGHCLASPYVFHPIERIYWVI